MKGNYTFNYKPGRTVEELENERLEAVLKTSYEERFRSLMSLIRLGLKMEKATWVVNEPTIESKNQ